MVGRRKQLKPNSAKGDRPEDITNLQSYADTRLSLVALPAEIQGIITSHVSTPRSNANQTYGGYHANKPTLACSTPRP